MARTSFRGLTSALLQEHALLRRALELFARYAGRVASGEPYDPRFARGFLRFFRTLTETDHGREEERLFLGRELFRELSAATEALRRAPTQEAARLRFHGLALRYVELALAHMQKEELVVFPLAVRDAKEQGTAAPRRVPAREVAWVRRMEVRARTWPPVAVSLFGQGSVSAFRRLCAESLRSSTRTRRSRTRRIAR
jgi:hemerythrin-like domain-containing protein